jgi:hypothetical protein
MEYLGRFLYVNAVLTFIQVALASVADLILPVEVFHFKESFKHHKMTSLVHQLTNSHHLCYVIQEEL